MDVCTLEDTWELSREMIITENFNLLYVERILYCNSVITIYCY